MKRRYICKCGKIVYKSTNADTTGNRDTEHCAGCPHLLPWGPDEYVTGQGFVKNVKGHECRMSKCLEYGSRFRGNLEDKTTCSVVSLDFAFLQQISDWIAETYPDRELWGSFSPDKIRPSEYCSNGRYRMSIACAQNKKGIAAKAALLHQFFDDSGHRKDKTPEEEKAIVLAAIEEGKAAARRKEDKEEHMETTKHTDERGIMTEAGELLPNGSECRRHAVSRVRAGMGKVQAIHVCDDQPDGVKIWLNAYNPAEYWVLSKSGEIGGEHIEGCPYCAALLRIGCGDVVLAPINKELENNQLPKIPDSPASPACSCAGCEREDCTCAGGRDAAGRADCTGEQNCAQSGCTYALKHRANPTSSVAATAAAEQTADGPERSDSADMTAVPAAESNGSADLATSAAADADLPEVCRGCQCVTCGNQDCDTPCLQKNYEVEYCEEYGPMEDDCKDYQPKEDIKCNSKTATTRSVTQHPDMQSGLDQSPTSVPSSSSPLASLAHAGAEKQSLSVADGASLAADPAPVFDYTGLDDQMVADLHLAEREYAGGKKMAEMGLRRMADAVAIAHDALCVTGATLCRTGGKFATPEQSFSSWCESIGIHRKADERLLQVSKLMDNSTPREQRVLEELPPTLLYAAAKPSAPAELVQAVKDGDITTHKQYQEAMAQLKAERQAREQAERKLADAQREHQAECASTSALLRDEQQRRQKAEEGRIAAEKEKVDAQSKAARYAEMKDAALETLKTEREKLRAAQSGQTQQLADAKKQWQVAADREKRAAVDAAIEQACTDARASAAVDVLFDQLENTVAALQAALETLEDTDADKADKLRRSLVKLLQTLAAQMGVG